MILYHLTRLVSHITRQHRGTVQGARLGARRRFRQPRSVLLGAVAMSSYDWEKEKLSDQDLVRHFKDIDFCSALKLETLTCQVCGLRLKVSVCVPGVTYCKCSHSKPGTSDWEPFVERKDILVWRKEHRQKKGLYHYKLYGVFDDITVWEFLAVQLDLSKFRLGWDSSTAQCRQVDKEDRGGVDEGVTNSTTLELSKGCGTPGGSSDAMVYYWEVHWPTFFSNRDYCCIRQHLTDPTGRMVISSRTTRHPTCPLYKNNWRVQDYHSVLAVRPTQHPDKPGVEFSLTAFEDPGVALPESIISFVAVRTMPEFMTNLRAACLKLRGALASTELPRPEIFRREALSRDNKEVFELSEDSGDALEENISKGDAAYESAWIDKLLKDSDESESESGENPVVPRKSSLEIEAENIRKDPAAVCRDSDNVGSGQSLDHFNTSIKAKHETVGQPSNLIKSVDDLDELDAEKNEFQNETLNLYKSERLSTYKNIKAQKRDRAESSSSNVLMDDITLNLNPTAVKDAKVPEPDDCVKNSPVSSHTRQNLLLVEESENGVACVDPGDPMSISPTSDPAHSQYSSRELSSHSLLSSEQIAASTGYVEYEMELLLYEEKEVSVQTTLLEHKMREVEGEGEECEEFLQLWFNLVSRKNLAFHRRLMLEILQREQDLERRCEILQDELRRGGKDEKREQLLMEELLRVVDLRDQLVMARDREEKSLQEEVMVDKEVKSKLGKQDNRKDKCKSQ